MKTKKKGNSTRSYRNKYTLPTSQKKKDGSEDKGVSGKTGECVQRDKSKYISIEEYERQKQEILRLRKLTETMQTQTNKVINLAREGKMDTFDDSFKTTVVEFTKRVIYPVCPYVSNSEQLDKCMKILANELELTDAKKAMFQYGYKHTVSSAIASKRNADVQSIRKELKALGHDAPTYNDIKDLRMAKSETEQKKVMTFYKKVLPCVSGKKKFKKIMHHKTISETVTVSLEALALWIIFNYEEKWSTEGTTRESPAKFTGVTKGNKIYSGWDAAGILKFNEFMEFVRFNRQEDNGVFEDTFKTEMKKEHEDRMIRKHNTTLPDDEVVCENDLDSKLSHVTKVIYTRETTKSYDTPTSNDSTSLSSQSSVSASSYHSVQHYNTDNSATYYEAL